PPRGAWGTEEQARVLERVSLLIVQDLLPTAVSAVANYVLPGGSWAEKDGTFVNHGGLAQAIRAAAHSPPQSRPDGRVFFELIERRGLAHGSTLRAELAREVPYFAPLAENEPGEFGIFLEKK